MFLGLYENTLAELEFDKLPHLNNNTYMEIPFYCLCA